MELTDNQAILNAILGLGAQNLPSTLNTGTFDPNSQQTNPGGQLPNMVLPLNQNPIHAGTLQQIANISQPNPQFSNYQNPIRHTVGRDSWSSGIGLDHESILNNLGLGRQR